MTLLWPDTPENVRAKIQAIEYHLPEPVLDNEQLAADLPGWDAQKIESKTGIRRRHIARESECASDLAVAAGKKLLATGVCGCSSIDYFLLCTQSPDYFLPTTACLVHQRLGLPASCGAFDINLGCSGFVYGLSTAKGLIESGQAGNVLLITADTYSKFIHPEDRSVRTIFGDGAAATLITSVASETDIIGPFIFGTDGAGAANLIVPAGGLRRRTVCNPDITEDENGNRRTANHLYMNGAEIFEFTLRTVPATVTNLLAKARISAGAIDYWVFHQANRYMLTHLCNTLHLPREKFIISMEDCGNTVSSSIPIALRNLQESGRLLAGHTLALVGFGVGYSWAGTLVRWM